MAKVLLIDDDDDTRALYRHLLEHAGHEVIESGSGVEGLRLVRAERPDCAIIDVGLPDVDGYEVAASIRSNDLQHAVGLAAVTGFGGEEARTRGRRAGFDVHLVKPVDASLVVATVAQLVGRRR